MSSNTVYRPIAISTAQVEVGFPVLRAIHRIADIPLLVNTLLEEIANENQQPAKVMSSEGLKVLMDSDWPGNVRELQNVLRQAFMRTEAAVIRASDLPLPKAIVAPEELSLKAAVDQFKRQMITETLHRCGGNRRKAALQLGLSRQNLQNQMRRLKIK